MSEITNTEPLLWVEDRMENRYFKECTLEAMQFARNQKLDVSVWDSRTIDHEWKEIFVPWIEVLTDKFIARYWKADTVDRFIYFSLPKYPDWVREKFKVSIWNLSREKKKSLTYNAIKITVGQWIHDKKYYSI